MKVNVIGICCLMSLLSITSFANKLPFNNVKSMDDKAKVTTTPKNDLCTKVERYFKGKKMQTVVMDAHDIKLVGPKGRTNQLRNVVRSGNTGTAILSLKSLQKFFPKVTLPEHVAVTLQFAGNQKSDDIKGITFIDPQGKCLVNFGSMR